MMIKENIQTVKKVNNQKGIHVAYSVTMNNGKCYSFSAFGGNRYLPIVNEWIAEGNEPEPADE